MSRAKQLINILEDGEESNPLINSTPLLPGEVSMSGDPRHTHARNLDHMGNGKLTHASDGEDHEHEVFGWEVKASSNSNYPHIHLVSKEPAAPCAPCDKVSEGDKTWDDEVSDTKEKVKVSVSKNAPHIKRVFDKAGKYMGSFDTKKTDQKNKYKTMFKGAK